MATRYIYLQPDLPELTDTEFWGDLASWILDNLYPAWMDARSGVEKKWMECDRGYLCERMLPPLEGFTYINKSAFGTPDIHNGVNNFCTRLTIGLMDDKDQWLTAVGPKGEDPAVSNAVKAEQAWMHRRSETRRYVNRGFRQVSVRGITHWMCRWDTEVVYRPVGTRKARRNVAKILKADGQDPAMIKKIHKIREPHVKFNGPIFEVVDAYDVFFDPEADILKDRKKSYIMRNYIRPHALKGAKDDNDQDIYSNLEKLDGTDASEAYMGEKDSGRRLRSVHVLGMNPSSVKSVSSKVVPVYTYFAPYLEYEGYEFFDTYFYVARADDNTPVLIRIEENPSVNGSDLLISETFIDWFTHAAYGISPTQTVLPIWNKKQLYDAIMDNAMASAAFPAMLLAAGALKGDEVRLGPGQIMELTQSIQGMDVLRPAINTAPAVQLGMTEQNFLKQEIIGVFETSGAYGQDGKDRETATAARIKDGQSNLTIAEHKEKFGSPLQKMAQWAYDTRQVVAEPEKNSAGEKVIPFNRMEDNKLIPDEILYDDWKRPRTMEITGSHGAFNKQQDIQNIMDGMKAIGQMGQYLPNVPTVAQDLVKGLFKEMELEVSPESWMTPEQIAANNPAVLQMALQSLINNPQMAAQVISQMGMEGGNGESGGGPIGPGGGDGGPPGAPGPGGGGA